MSESDVSNSLTILKSAVDITYISTGCRNHYALVIDDDSYCGFHIWLSCLLRQAAVGEPETMDLLQTGRLPKLSKMYPVDRHVEFEHIPLDTFWRSRIRWNNDWRSWGTHLHKANVIRTPFVYMWDEMDLEDVTWIRCLQLSALSRVIASDSKLLFSKSIGLFGLYCTPATLSSWIRPCFQSLIRLMVMVPP